VENQAPSDGLAGLRVVSFESRRAAEIAKLIASYGGLPIVAPSMQEVPLESNTAALAFARTLVEGGFAMVIFLTGVGTRALTRVVETVYPRERVVAALGRVAVVARGPKPVAALKEWGVPVTLVVPEPNTWRELLRALDEQADALSLKGRSIAVQEYGSANPELLAGLAERGAVVTRVPVYEWALPDDTGPLRAAIQTIAREEADIALFTTSVQVVHLLRVAEELDLGEAVRRAFSRIVVGSIGPMTSEVLRQHGLPVNFEPARPRMGFLVNEAAQRGHELLARKRGRVPPATE
jgi:uroporphyrinogen-III synthase